MYHTAKLDAATEAKPTADLRRTIRGNTLAIFVTRACSIVIDGLTYILTARYFGPVDYGQYLSIMAFINIVDLAADMSLMDISVREMARDEESAGGWLAAATLLRLAMALLGVAAFTFYLWRNGLLDDDIRASALAAALFPAAAFRMPLSLFRARMKMTEELVTVLAARFCNLGGFALLIAAGLPVWTFFAATLASRLVLAGVGWQRTLTRFALTFRIRWYHVRSLCIEAAPMAVSGLFVALQLKLDILMLARLAGKGPAGLFGAVAQLPEFSLALPVIISTPILPVISQAFQRSDMGEFQMLYQRMFDVIFALAVPATVVAATMPRQTVTLLFGERYAEAAAVLPMLLLATVLMWISHATAIAAVASGLQWHFVWIQAICMVLYLVLNGLWIPDHGEMGAAVVRVLTTGVAAALTFWLVRDRTGAGLSIRAAGRTAVAGAGMALVVYLCSGLPVLAAVCAGIAFYAGATWIQRGQAPAAA